MKTGRLNRAATGEGVSARIVVLLVAVALLSFSCRRSTPPPPPPAPPVAAAPPPAPAPTISLTASQTTITAGQSTTLQWTSANASTVAIEPGIGTVATSGMRAVSPTSSVTYNATATGPGGTASAPLRITVNPAQAAAPPPAPTPPPSLTIDQLFARDMQAVLFDFDRAEVRPDQIGKIQAAAQFLQQNAGVQITVSGHADERGSQEYNIGLGDRRANSVRQALIERGIAGNRINTVSYGEERPVCRVSNETCWQQNRRAEYARR